LGGNRVNLVKNIPELAKKRVFLRGGEVMVRRKSEAEKGLKVAGLKAKISENQANGP
jgi:hypothetical protein